MVKRRKKKQSLYNKFIISLIVLIIASLFISYSDNLKNVFKYGLPTSYGQSYDIGDIPEYNGASYVVINDNEPQFTEEDYNTKELEI